MMPLPDHTQDKESLEHVEEKRPSGSQGTTSHGESDQPVLASAYVALGPMEMAKKFWRIPLICCAVGFGAVMDGYAITIPGSVVANQGFINQFGTVVLDGVLQIDARYVGGFTGVQSGGQILGMLTGPFTSDLFGRKFNMFLMTAILALGVILEIVAKTNPVFLASRLFAGWGTGLAQSGLTVYISELAPPQIRGALLASYSFWFAFGQLMASVGLQVLATTQPLNYLNAFYSEWVLIGLFVPIAYFVPESPWWCAKVGKHDKAKRCLKTMYGNVKGYDVEHEYAVLLAGVEDERRLSKESSSIGLISIFKGVNLRRTFISFAPLAYQQFLGSSLIFGYLAFFFQLAGFENPFIVNVIVFVLLLVFIVVSFFTVEKFGRRPLLLSGSVVMGLSTLLIAVIGTVPGLQVKAGGGLIALACIWAVAYALSLGPLGYSYLAESSAPFLRAKTAGFADAGTACFGLIFNYTVPLMLSPQQANWNTKIGYFFSGLTFLGLIIIYFTIPEFKGRTEAELDEMFEAKVPTRQFATYRTKADEIRKQRAVL